MTRIQLDLPDERVAELDDLMSSLGITTRKELFNNALTLLEWAVSEKRSGRIIASIDEEERKLKQLVMPTLERLSTSQSNLVATKRKGA